VSELCQYVICHSTDAQTLTKD